MADFRTVLIEDARIADITSQEVYGVQSSASQSTYQQFQAVSSSNSSIVFNIQVPSENIVIDRHVLIQSTITFTVRLANVPVGEQCFQYGLTDCVQAFPLNSLFTTTQCTINNTSTSTNTQDVLPMLMRMNDKRMLSRFNSMTPSLPDCQWGYYKDAVGTNSNPLASFNNNSYDEDFSSRGSYPVDIIVSHYVAGVYVNNSVISTSLNDTWVIVITGKFTEPFLALSPWVNTQPANNAGLVGVNNMSWVLNIDNQCKRLFSTANTNVVVGAGDTRLLTSYITSISLGSTAQSVGFQNTRLLFNFLSLQPEQYAKIATKNVVPYYDTPRYLTTFTNSISLAPLASATITSQSIQLNQVPDMILICARVPMSAQTWANTSSFLTIKGITVNFNNASGLLASATQNDLYLLSARNGSAQSFYEFQGESITNNNATGNVNHIPTTGSLLVLNPVYDFSLPSYLSSSSLGQYQFQFNLQVSNQFDFTIVPELCIVCYNSGLFITQQGTSSIYTGILTKQQVLDTKAQNPTPHLDSSEYQRLVGGRMSNMGMSNVLKMIRDRHQPRMMSPLESGAGVSGGAVSGGKRGSRLSKYVK
jgi:hypothetical protein